MPNAFVDTNVLVYAADESASDRRKTRIARELLRQRDLQLSVQVLNEFTVNARHPSKLNFTPQQENDWLSRWLLFPVASADGRHLSQRPAHPFPLSDFPLGFPHPRLRPRNRLSGRLFRGPWPRPGI